MQVEKSTAAFVMMGYSFSYVSWKMTNFDRLAAHGSNELLSYFDDILYNINVHYISIGSHTFNPQSFTCGNHTEMSVTLTCDDVKVQSTVASYQQQIQLIQFTMILLLLFPSMINITDCQAAVRLLSV